MELPAQAIREVEFREKLRGYHPDDVDAFVERVAIAVEALTQRVTEMETARAGEGGVSEATIQRTLVMAQRTADMVLAEANESAARIMAAAQTEADTLLAEANDTVQRSIDEAERRLETDLARLEEARYVLSQDVVALQDYVRQQRAVLRDALVDQLRLIDETGHEQLDPPPVLHDTRPGVVEDVAVPAPAVGASEVPASEVGASGVGASEVPTPGGVGPDLAVPALGEPQPAVEGPARHVADPVAVAPGALFDPASRPAPYGAASEGAPLAADDPYDMYARGRQVESRMPAEGEDDPFLAELWRAVDDPGAETSGAWTSQEAAGSHAADPDAALSPDPSRPSPEADELGDMPDAGRMSGRLFRRR